MVSWFLAFFFAFPRWSEGRVKRRLRGFPKKTRGGLHNASTELYILALGILGSQVFEVCSAERATQGMEMKIHVVTPLIVQRAEEKRPNRASFGTTEPLKFPDVRQEILELFGRRSDRNA